MTGQTLALVELVAVFALVLGFAGYQLWSVRRDTRKAEEEKRRNESGEKNAGHANVSSQSAGKR